MQRARVFVQRKGGWEGLLRTVMKAITNDKNGAVRKPVYENSEDRGSPLSVFVEDPATRTYAPLTDNDSSQISGCRSWNNTRLWPSNGFCHAR
jgi:hypothetical protein